jgi:hypothetical protein
VGTTAGAVASNFTSGEVSAIMLSLSQYGLEGTYPDQTRKERFSKPFSKAVAMGAA